MLLSGQPATSPSGRALRWADGALSGRAAAGAWRPVPVPGRSPVPSLHPSCRRAADLRQTRCRPAAASIPPAPGPVPVRVDAGRASGRSAYAAARRGDHLGAAFANDAQIEGDHGPVWAAAPRRPPGLPLCGTSRPSHLRVGDQRRPPKRWQPTTAAATPATSAQWASAASDRFHAAHGQPPAAGPGHHTEYTYGGW